MVTVTQDYAHMVEAMMDEQVMDQLMTVLRKMYGEANAPEPTGIIFPRWHSDPLFRGSYSNWPISEVDQHHMNMKARFIIRFSLLVKPCPRSTMGTSRVVGFRVKMPRRLSFSVLKRTSVLPLRIIQRSSMLK
ncbi:hypothetical protein BC941DRAFT_485093 [Chlamydoabsidia padenii]|nr:hypothetical protein BC941DRAFT_485093 [Chlamydoabsidia padenii]